MIKATIQNSPYCTEIRFPCSETELSKQLGEIGMNTEHLAPMATVLEIEHTELSMLEDCDVSIDALNYLGKRLLIAHRMRTVSGADKVVVLSDGTVAEQGQPGELHGQNGIYARMVKLQTESQSWSIG